MDIREFVKDNGITIQSLRLSAQRDAGEWSKDAFNFVCVLYLPTGSTMEAHYSMGPAYGRRLNGKIIAPVPTVIDVIDCLKSDAECPDDFDEFCSAFGADSDSRKAMTTFKACRKIARDLRDWLGPVKFAELMECEPS